MLFQVFHNDVSELSLAVIVLLFADMAVAGTPNRVTILYDSFGKFPSLTMDWGFAALVEYGGQRAWHHSEGHNSNCNSHVFILLLQLKLVSAGRILPWRRVGTFSHRDGWKMNRL